MRLRLGSTLITRTISFSPGANARAASEPAGIEISEFGTRPVRPGSSWTKTPGAPP